MQSIVIFLILCNFLIHADLLQINANRESEEKNPSGSASINEKLSHSPKITEPKNVQETSTVTDSPAKPSTDKCVHLSQQTESTSVGEKEPDHSTTMTTTAATTTTATTTTTKTTTPRTYKMYKEPLPLLSRTEIKNVQETQTTNKNTLNQSANQNSSPTHPELNSVGRKENNDVIVTNRDESVHSIPLPLLHTVEGQNIHESNVGNNGTTEKPEKKKPASSPSPKLHSGEEMKDDDTRTKTIASKNIQEISIITKNTTEKPEIKKVSTTALPPDDSDEDYVVEIKEYDPADCVNCCNKDEIPCTNCCDIIPYLSEFVLKSAGG